MEVAPGAPAEAAPEAPAPEQQAAAGAAPNVVRLSIGIEDADDIIDDLD